ncbi:FG-GAP-like repeat-containing protein [Polaribacter batillariae]|uniref:FG-GAP-like repeat-containing protein n=1 Tax=Polaribacter batillariae TaxID=2808900 RepID=UPI001FB08871|nr:FG-GAP-like repeat-containing protein [Polaribacter batillariae]
MSNSSFSQIFKRVEVQAKLAVLSENMGVSVADYDGDNDLDIFIVGNTTDENNNLLSTSKLFKNLNNGVFEDVTKDAGLLDLSSLNNNDIPDSSEDSGYNGYKFGASWGDYNNDGFPDLLFTNAYSIQLFKNNGNGTFVEVTTEAGFLKYNNCYNTSATWFDYNKDGFLDLYIGDYASTTCDGNSFYRNNGDGTFKEISKELGVQSKEKFTYMSMPIDVNNDGWLDLYLANDFGENDLYINKNGLSFENQTNEYQLNNNLNGMGLTVGDYNNDGYFDLYLTNILKNALFKNNGNNLFEDVAVEENVLNATWAWNTRFSDFDLDGDEDLFVVNGFVGAKSKNVYFKNLLVEGQEGFSKMSNEVGLVAKTYSIGSEIFDFDNDGDLDVFVSNVEQSSFLYENKTIESSKAENPNWFKVHLKGTISNRNAIGTKLEIKTIKGSQYRFYTGVGLFSQSLQPVHFGLNEANEILELKITWPSGEKETYLNLPVNKTILATEKKGYEVIEIKPSEKIAGCTDPNSCNYNPNATINDGSCSYLPSKQISGNTNSTYLKSETYTYTLENNATAIWSVVGGEIIEGQGTGTVKIKWHLSTVGKITVVETNNTCSSLPVELNVDLKISEVLKNQSIARIWNEALLIAIRGDYARPTVHARNLFHSSIAMYDAWAIHNDRAKPYLIGNNVHNFNSKLTTFTPSEGKEASINKTISYAVYRLLCHRFKNSPNAKNTLEIFDLIMNQMRYDKDFTSTDYTKGNAGALGNFIAETIINYGFVDGAEEQTDYQNKYYKPENPPLRPSLSGDGNLKNPNRWQPLSFNVFIDQSGNLIQETTPDFLSPEWGNVHPFSLHKSDISNFKRNNGDYKVYNNPGAPPYLGNDEVSSNAYKWGFSLVSKWSSHLNVSDNVLWDISPKSIGNISPDQYPTNFEAYKTFYKELEGGDIGKGHAVNPITNQPYQTQMVPRGDYTRVLAEFWADGPDSETPPGHWFTILNYVNDHPLFVKKIKGEGGILESLEWDVKAYFILGGAMHDSAIAAWSIKGWYDYIRPISAIRYMANKGQSSNTSLDNYHAEGIPLEEGLVEIVKENDPLAGDEAEHVGKIKLYAWKGHRFINNPEKDQSGVGWILAENWVPYQRASFVTPPFAGYVSGHSTFSRAAAEVITLLTGSPYFPGGYGEFIAKKNKFLVFEEGPSMDVKLQWATYRDASDQCSLSRIWGGIHPPADDIPGRLIGEKIGVNAFNFANEYFNIDTKNEAITNITVFPNPLKSNEIWISNTTQIDDIKLYDLKGVEIKINEKIYIESLKRTKLSLPLLASGVYMVTVNSQSKKLIIQ